MDNTSNMWNKNQKEFQELKQPISCELIETIEKRFHFSLPAEYRDFISKIGNGGSLCVPEEDSIELTEFGDHLNLEHIHEEFELQDSWSTTDAEDFELFLEKKNKGYFMIASDDTDCNEYWLLIVTGAFRGEVWLMDDYGILRLPKVYFNEWLDLYLNHKLSSKIEELAAKEREKQKSSDPLLAIREAMTHRSCRKIKWNPPIAMNEVRAFEREHGIELPEEYVEFITQIADGCYHFDATNSKQGGTMFRLNDFSSLKRLNEPFPFDQNTKEIRSHLFWNYNRDHSIWQSEVFAGISPEQEPSDIWASPDYSVISGALPFAVYHDNGICSENTQVLLILNGPLKGKIWKAERFSLSPQGEDDTFYTWMWRMLKYGAI